MVSQLRRAKSFILSGCVLFGFAYLFFRGGKIENLFRRKNVLLKPVSNSDKWIVVTSIAAPTEDIKELAKLPGWKVVVVGDVKTPKNWEYDNCHFLSYDDQLNSGFGIVSVLPKGNYARKNIGYLYAILNGAKVIYETDDDNRPLDKLQNFVYDKSMTGLMYQPRENNRSMLPNTFNPYGHFGQPTIWPRGFPLKDIAHVDSSDYILRKWRTPLVQQGVVDGDPDVDAIFRLSRKSANAEFNVRFNKRLPRVIIPHNTYTPYNSQNTLHLYDAFWGLLLPCTVNFRVTDIWRGYWAQRLLQEIDGHLAFFPPNAHQKRNAHSYYKDFLDEDKLYQQAESLIKMLNAWTCPKELSFFQCAIDLMDEMAKGEYVNVGDSELIRLWIDDFRRIKYKEPKRILKSKAEENSVTVATSKVVYNATFESPPMKAKQVQETNVRGYRYLSDISNFCPDIVMKPLYIKNIQNMKKFENILLVIVFNHPFYQNVKYLEMMWRVFFPNIIYCGDNIEQFKRQTKNVDVPLMFVEQKAENRYTARCMVEAIKMNYDVDGYLYLHDDSLLNVWQIYDLPLDRFWTSTPNLMLESVPNPYSVYKKPFGLKAYQKSLKELQDTDVDRYKRFKKTLDKNTGKMDGFYWIFSDLVYFPRKHADDVEFLMDIFCRNSLYHEITIPTAIAAIEPKEKWYIMNGTYLSMGQRQIYEKFFDITRHFMHPFKLSSALKGKRERNFFCDKIITSTLLRIR